jgi:enediyne biosynthesis protein E3
MSAPTREFLAPLREARSRFLTPDEAEVSPARRGFYPWCEGAGIVEPVGLSFIGGFRIGVRQASPVSVIRTLERTIDPDWIGFAAEGAGMAVALRAVLEPWNRGAFDRLLAVSGGRHTYMMHVGLGWALARVPEALWPDLGALDPLVGPLVIDGYGFHEAFFHTRRTLDAKCVVFPTRRWPGHGDEAQQQAMQGVGRGLWFVAGGSEEVIGELIDDHDPRWHASMWAGVGLAATYAGGREEGGLQALRARAGKHLAWLRQGSAFAVEARHRAGTTTAHTGLAAVVLCGRSLDEMTDVVAATRPSPRAVDAGDWGAYERWRSSIALELGGE